MDDFATDPDLVAILYRAPTAAPVREGHRTIRLTWQSLLVGKPWREGSRMRSAPASIRPAGAARFRRARGGVRANGVCPLVTQSGKMFHSFC